MNQSITAFLASPEKVDDFLAITRKETLEKTFDTTDGDRLKKMVECMGDTRGMTRLGFAETLGLLGKPATPFLIDALLHHENVVVRRASGKTITLIADPDAVEALVYAHFNDDDTVVKGSTIGALARIGKEAVVKLLDILKNQEASESTKGHAAWALAFIGVDAKKELYQEINSESVSVRSAVIGAIAKIAGENGETKDFEVLINALNDPSEVVRCEAAAVLGNLAYKPAIPTLLKLLDHATSGTRKSATLALMKIKDISVIDSLQTALAKEPDAELKPIFNLAISQLEKQVDADDDDDWD